MAPRDPNQLGPESGVETRYSPPQVVGAFAQPITGNSDPAYISTSYVERQNLTMRMRRLHAVDECLLQEG
jgi:hypothetical protein